MAESTRCAGVAVSSVPICQPIPFPVRVKGSSVQVTCSGTQALKNNRLPCQFIVGICFLDGAFQSSSSPVQSTFPRATPQMPGSSDLSATRWVWEVQAFTT